MRCLDGRMTHKSVIGPSLVVGDNKEDVGFADVFYYGITGE
jgi:hypothetical protein